MKQEDIKNILKRLETLEEKVKKLEEKIYPQIEPQTMEGFPFSKKI